MIKQIFSIGFAHRRHVSISLASGPDLQFSRITSAEQYPLKHEQEHGAQLSLVRAVRFLVNTLRMKRLHLDSSRYSLRPVLSPALLEEISIPQTPSRPPMSFKLSEGKDIPVCQVCIGSGGLCPMSGWSSGHQIGVPSKIEEIFASFATHFIEPDPNDKADQTAQEPRQTNRQVIVIDCSPVERFSRAVAGGTMP